MKYTLFIATLFLITYSMASPSPPSPQSSSSFDGERVPKCNFTKGSEFTYSGYYECSITDTSELEGVTINSIPPSSPPSSSPSPTSEREGEGCLKLVVDTRKPEYCTGEDTVYDLSLSEGAKIDLTSYGGNGTFDLSKITSFGQGKEGYNISCSSPNLGSPSTGLETPSITKEEVSITELNIKRVLCYSFVSPFVDSGKKSFYFRILSTSIADLSTEEKIATITPVITMIILSILLAYSVNTYGDYTDIPKDNEGDNGMRAASVTTSKKSRNRRNRRRKSRKVD